MPDVSQLGRGPASLRVRTLADVGRIVCTLGLSCKPMTPRAVHAIERRVLDGIRRDIEQNIRRDRDRDTDN